MNRSRHRKNRENKKAMPTPDENQEQVYQSEHHNDVLIHVVTDGKDSAVHSVETPPTGNSRLSVVSVALVLLVLIVGAFFFASGSTPSTPSNATASVSSSIPAKVTITSVSFVPATVRVKVGQVVTWTNNDTSQHIVASDPYPTDNSVPGFNAKQAMSTNDSFSYVFNKVGTYTYHDDLNPYSLEGTVIVTQ
jgi:plastocyanin